MKRELIQNILPIPLGTEEEAIDRSGFLSAVVAVKPKGSGELTLKVTHADTKEGSYVDVPDTKLFVNGNKVDTVAEGDLVLFDLDLVGCKQFIKVTLDGAGKGESPAAAIVLGDAATTPVETPDESGE